MMQEVEVTVKTHKEGKTIEEINKKSIWQKLKSYLSLALFLVFLLRTLVPAEFWTKIYSYIH
jgi:hypothetical protein